MASAAAPRPGSCIGSTRARRASWWWPSTIAPHQALTRQFSNREVEKEYVALVWGVVHAGRRIEASIGRDPRHRQRMSVRAERNREAVTRITRVEHLRGVTLAAVAIATGRTHQIRVHLQSIGHPVVGDALYGGTRRRLPAHLGVLGQPRPTLPARRPPGVRAPDRRATADVRRAARVRLARGPGAAAA